MDGSAPRSSSGSAMLDHRALDQEQARRLRRARRTAMIAGAVAVSFFVLSIAQLLWVKHLGLH
jgi:hypothetical protein